MITKVFGFMYLSSCICVLDTFLYMCVIVHSKKQVQKKKGRKEISSLFFKCIVIFSRLNSPVWLSIPCLNSLNCLHQPFLFFHVTAIDSWLSLTDKGKAKSVAQKTWILVLQHWLIPGATSGKPLASLGLTFSYCMHDEAVRDDSPGL